MLKLWVHLLSLWKIGQMELMQILSQMVSIRFTLQVLYPPPPTPLKIEISSKYNTYMYKKILFQVSCVVDSRPCPISPTEIQREDLQRIQIENE